MTEEAQSVYFDTQGVSIATTGPSVRARWLIFATGSPSWPARTTQQKPSKTDSMIAFWAQMPARLQERLLFVEPSDRGWWYLCPADGAGAIACFVTDPLSARSLALSKTLVWNKLFQATGLSLQLPGDKAAERVHVALTGLAALPQTHGPRWTAVGDAAAALDPLGSSGTTTALHSGQLAGHAVADALMGNTSPLDDYSRWSSGLVAEFARQRRHQYARAAAKHNSSFWSRRVQTLASRTSTHERVAFSAFVGNPHAG
jgi:flavin-dependent dehydrogenase